MRDEIKVLLKEYEVGRISRRVFVQSLAALVAAPALPSFLGTPAFAMAEEFTHFSSKGKMPSEYTIQAQQQQRKILPLADKQDFEEAKRGFIAAPPYRKIMNDKGDVACGVFCSGTVWRRLIGGDAESLGKFQLRSAIWKNEAHFVKKWWSPLMPPTRIRFLAEEFERSLRQVSHCMR